MSTDDPFAIWLALHIKKRVEARPGIPRFDFPVAKPGHGREVADRLRPLLPDHWTVGFHEDWFHYGQTVITIEPNEGETP